MKRAGKLLVMMLSVLMILCFPLPVSAASGNGNSADPDATGLITSYALSCTAGTNSQRWRLEKTNNGKFIFNGKYRIRNPSGKYIHTTDNSSLFLSNTATVWSIELDSTFGEDNFFRIYKMVGTTRKYFDVLNNHNSEGNTVQLHTLTSYVNAQTWKFMLLSDGQIWIVPKISINRGLKGTTTSMQISVTPTSWILEREGDL